MTTERGDNPASASVEPLVRRVRLRNYKSIGQCDLNLGGMTFLVGRNGAGKSNFLDALRFVADSLDTSLDHAIKARGGIDEVRRRSTGHPRNFLIEVELNLPDWKVALFSFEVAAREKGGFQVKREQLEVRKPSGEVEAEYDVVGGVVERPTGAQMPPAAPDRLYLVTASSLPQYRGVYDALRSMGFYNLNPQEMKELQSPDAGELLHRDGSNIASVVARLVADSPAVMERVREYLSKIAPGVIDVKRVALGPRETLEFRQEMVGAQHPWRFHAANMSDGTLRALGVLIAVSQLVGRERPVRLVGIEEPETALHPAAAGFLMDALREASMRTQVIVTSHSPDLLDQLNGDPRSLLVVLSEEGETRIAEVDRASREAIKGHLYTPGDLLRMDQLQPDPEDIKRQMALDFERPGGVA
mgnify:CR=1 FL=1